jgi:hypothetical protein
MKWTDDPEKVDLRISLVYCGVTLGQAVKDGEGAGWHGYDYLADNGAGKHLGLFDTLEQAKEAVVSSVKERKLQ